MLRRGVPYRQARSEAWRAGSRGTGEPPPEERPERRRQGLALTEIDDHELAARGDVLPAMGDGALQGGIIDSV